jgi:hypothetical protein
MRERSLLKVGIAVVLTLIGLALLWIVLLGPAALMLMSPRA